MSGAAAAAALPVLDRRRPELRAVPAAGRDGAADVCDGVADRRAILWRARDLALLADAHGDAREVPARRDLSA